MKKIVLGVAAIFLISVNQLKAQSWVPVLTVPVTNGQFKSVHFSDDMHGWAAGHNGNGMIYATTDGGVNWTEQSPNFFARLFDVYFINNNTGWAVGQSGAIYKTTNGGANWTNIANITNNDPALQKVFFSSLTNGYVIGTNGGWSTTTDGGTTWSGTDLNGSNYDAIFTSPQIGISAGLGFIGRTTNGGTSWTQNFIGNAWRGIDTSSINNLWVVGDDGYMTSTDQGATWSSTNASMVGHDIKFLNANVGWVAQIGGIRKTTDGGATWAVDFTGNIYFTGIHARSETNVFMTAKNFTETEAYIYRYSCAGVSAPASQGFSGTNNPTPCPGASFSLTALSPSTNTITWTFPADWTVTSYTGANNQTVNGVYGSLAGQITLTATNSCGLTSTPFTYNVTPQTIVIQAPTFITQIGSNGCLGGNNSFQTSTAPAGTEYVWSSNNWAYTGGNPVSLNPYGTFITDVENATVSVYLQNSCGGLSNTFTETFSLNLDAPLPAPVITFSGGVLSTTATAYEYCWSWSGPNETGGDSCIIGSAGMNFTPSVNEEYYLTVQTINGCETESNIILVSGINVGIEENVSSFSSIYPNPTNGMVTVSSSQIGGMLQVIDATGRIVSSKRISSENTTIDLSENNSGVYFVSIKGTDGTSNTKKLIVRK